MNKNKWVAAYNDIVKHLYETMDEALHSLGEALEISTEKTRKTSDLSKEDLEKVSSYVKRDIESAAHGLHAKSDDESLSECQIRYRTDREFCARCVFERRRQNPH